eukprot:6202276-Amphidinium_carterae.1
MSSNQKLYIFGNTSLFWARLSVSGNGMTETSNYMHAHSILSMTLFLCCIKKACRWTIMSKS